MREFRENTNYSYFISKVKKFLLPVSDILAYCLMPNHYHLLVKVKSDKFSASMHKLALSYVVSYNNLYNRRGHLFFFFFRRIPIHKHSYLVYLSMYIHTNPVKANLASKAENWKHSSYCEFIGNQKIDFIHPEFILDMICADINSSISEQQIAYRDYVESWIDKNRD